MRGWTGKADRRGAMLAAALAVGLAGGCTSGSPASGLAIQSMDGTLSGGSYSLAVDLEIGLTPAVLEALHNGVPISIVLETRVVEPRGWLWPRTVVQDNRAYTLSFQSLSSQYLIRAPDAPASRAYPSREVALSVLESPDPAQLDLPGGVDPAELTAEARVRLDLQALPAPLRLVAYFSPDWRIGSGWHRERLVASQRADD